MEEYRRFLGFARTVVAEYYTPSGKKFLVKNDTNVGRIVDFVCVEEDYVKLTIQRRKPFTPDQ